ncbi:hypothetical protein CPB86DRAFT_777852 [Serendipita vermifera]|nr:hypothetical protein CPB86DRAFT_777852 [Serendipita vermifera]
MELDARSSLRSDNLEPTPSAPRYDRPKGHRQPGPTDDFSSTRMGAPVTARSSYVEATESRQGPPMGTPTKPYRAESSSSHPTQRSAPINRNRQTAPEGPPNFNDDRAISRNNHRSGNSRHPETVVGNGVPLSDFKSRAELPVSGRPDQEKPHTTPRDEEYQLPPVQNTRRTRPSRFDSNARSDDPPQTEDKAVPKNWDSYRPAPQTHREVNQNPTRVLNNTERDSDPVKLGPPPPSRSPQEVKQSPVSSVDPHRMRPGGTNREERPDYAEQRSPISEMPPESVNTGNKNPLLQRIGPEAPSDSRGGDNSRVDRGQEERGRGRRGRRSGRGGRR